MTPQTTQPTKLVTQTVFDLTSFDDVKLGKLVTLPTKPTTLEEALAAVGNDIEKLMNVIHEGLIADACDAAKTSVDGFQVIGEDGTLGDPYTGKYADETKGKAINGAILSLAKLFGYSKDAAPELKRELKAKALDLIKSNPAMLESIQS